MEGERHSRKTLSTETYKKIQDRKNKKAVFNTSRTTATKAKAQEEYSEANREVKNSVSRDKREYLEGHAKQAEEAAASRNMKQLYDTMNKLAGKFQLAECAVKDKVERGSGPEASRSASRF